jgi:hypothetical protein
MPATSEPSTATARFCAAMEAGDAAGAVEPLAPDVVLHSPITLGVEFRGRDQLRELFEDVHSVVSDIRYSEEVGDGGVRVIVGEGRVARERLHETVLVRLDDAGLIRELTLYIRPLPGLAALAAALGPRVARRRGRTRAVAAAALMLPMATAIRAGERSAVRLVTPASRAG